MKGETRNFLIAIIASIIIFWGFNFFYPQKEISKIPPQTPQRLEQPEVHTIAPVILERSDALQLSQRVTFDNNVVQGSVNLTSGAIDDLALKKYKETLESNSDFIKILHPTETAMTNAMMFDILTVDQPDQAATPWRKETTTDRLRVRLTKETDKLKINRTYLFSDDYSIEVVDSIQNITDQPQKIRPVQKLIIGDHSLVDSFTAVSDKKLHETTPAGIKKKEFINYQNQSGWTGAGNKYWFTAFLNAQNQRAEFLMTTHKSGYEMRLSYPVTVIGPNSTYKQKYISFCGPKDLDVLENISKSQGIKQFDLSLDFGWFYFITKPTLQFINWLYKWIGNFGFAIIILTTLMKLALWPLAVKSHKSMIGIRKLSPKMKKIKEKYGDDKIRMNQEIMALYQKEKVKPMGGCLPILLQIPIFFCLYKVLTVNIAMRHAPFIGWIKDLSEPDPTSFVNLFGLLPFEAPGIFMIGLLPVLMGVTMYIQQRLTPQAYSDPQQEKMMLLLPFFLTYIFASFPAGLVLYWLWTNVLSILQQMWMNRYYT